MSIYYLDQDVLSNLAKAGGQPDAISLQNYLKENKNYIAISFNHIMEFSRIPETASKGYAKDFLPISIGELCGKLPIVKIKSMVYVFTEEFRAARDAWISGEKIKELDVFGAWEWMGAQDQDASVPEAIAYFIGKDQKAPSKERISNLIEMNYRFRESVKKSMIAGDKAKKKSFEEILKENQARIYQDIFMDDDYWPTGIKLSPGVERQRRKHFLDNFNLTDCPTFNLYVVMSSYQQYNAYHEPLQRSDFADYGHAALACQYADFFVTGDRVLRRTLGAAKKYLPFKAKVLGAVSEIWKPS